MRRFGQGRGKGRAVGKIDHVIWSGAACLAADAGERDWGEWGAAMRALCRSARRGYQRGIMGSPIRILGIDPGLRRTGWGLIEVDGNRLILRRLRLGRDQRQGLARRAAGDDP